MGLGAAVLWTARWRGACAAEQGSYVGQRVLGNKQRSCRRADALLSGDHQVGLRAPCKEFLAAAETGQTGPGADEGLRSQAKPADRSISWGTDGYWALACLCLQAMVCGFGLGGGLDLPPYLDGDLRL